MAIVERVVKQIPQETLAAMVGAGHEQVVFCHDAASGLRGIIAIHNTSLGPALGGIRMRPYPTEAEALEDVLRLSRAMTFKSAVASLDLGGGKSVIIGSPDQKSEALFRAMGRFIHSLGGRYIAATDVGTTVDDLTYVRAETPHVTGLPEEWGGLGDTSVLTGLTVYLGMKAGAEAVWGSDSLAAKRVLVQGAGKVGRYLMSHLREEGADILVAEVNGTAAAYAAEHFGVRVVPAEDVLDIDCDILSPNALGGLFDDQTIARVRCPLVCGGANNQLAEPRHGEALHQRGILYVPDYVVNSGGVISAFCEVHRAPRARAEQMAARVSETTRRVLEGARREGIAPSTAAERIATERIEQMAAVHRPYLAGDLRQS